MLLMNGYSQSPSWIEFKDASTTVAEGSWTPIELSNSEFWGDAGAEKDKSWFISSLFEGVGTLLLEGDECESGICSVLIVSMGDKAGSDCGNAEEKKRHISNNFLGFPPLCCKNWFWIPKFSSIPDRLASIAFITSIKFRSKSFEALINKRDEH